MTEHWDGPRGPAARSGALHPAPPGKRRLTTNEALSLFSNSHLEEDQAEARGVLSREPRYFHHLATAYFANPFLRLTDDESGELAERLRPSAIGDLISARAAAAGSPARRVAVFSMPKSGSTFLKNALVEAFQAPFVTLTSFCDAAQASNFGINGREQELDEMALVKAIILNESGFVAQHHTRYSPYLAMQTHLYGISPVIAVRNILDCIVSFDDMMRNRSDGSDNWARDPQFSLPSDYHQLEDEARYTILVHSFGVWLVNFYLSWKRGLQQGRVKPVIVKYEDHVLNGEALADYLPTHLPMSPEQADRFRAYVCAPNPGASRFNVGRHGRGEERLPEHLIAFLAAYVELFKGDLSSEDIRYLIR